MARLRDVHVKPRFFIRKPILLGQEEELLCEKCLHHKAIIMAREGCDYVIYTNLSFVGKAFSVFEQEDYLHLWCGHQDEPPKCIEAFKVDKYV